jgi:hypothetical protein
MTVKARPDAPADALALMLDDLRSLHEALASACELHLREAPIAGHEPTASLLGRTRDILRRQATEGQTLRSELPTTPGLEHSADTANSALVADFFLRLRKPRRSPVLRDVSTLLNLAAAELGILHSAALAMKQEEIARVALAQLGELTPLVLEISRLLPGAAVADLASRSIVADPLAAEAAQNNIQEAWRDEPAELHHGDGA